MAKKYEVSEIMKDVILKNTSLKEALDSTSPAGSGGGYDNSVIMPETEQEQENPNDPNKNISNRGAKTFEESLTKRWSPTAGGFLDPEKDLISPELAMGRKPLSDSPAERMEQDAQIRALSEKAKRYFDPQNKMGDAEVGLLGKALFNDPEAQKWLAGRQADDKAAETLNGFGAPFEEKNVSGKETVIEASIRLAKQGGEKNNKSKSLEKDIEYQSGKMVQALLNNERAYLSLKKRAVYNDLGQDGIMSVLQTKAEQRKLIDDVKKTQERLKDPNLAPEEREVLTKYLEEIIPAKQEKIDKAMLDLGDKKDAIKSFEEYDSESIQLQQTSADYLLKYPEYKKRELSEIKMAAMAASNYAKGAGRLAFGNESIGQEMFRQATKIALTGINMLNVTDNDAVAMFAQDVAAGLDAAEPNERGWLGHYTDVGVDAISSMALMYGLGLIGAGTRAAAVENSGTMIGKYLQQTLRNPSTYAVGLSSYGDGRREMQMAAIEAGMSDKEALSYSRSYGVAMGLANAMPEGLFDEVALFKGLGAKGFINLLSTGKKIGIKEVAKNIALPMASEQVEEFTTMGMEKTAKAVVNAYSAKQVFDDVIPTTSEILDTFVGTLIASGAMSGMTGGFDVKKQAIREMAIDPITSIKGLDNLVAMGQQTPEAIGEIKNALISMTGIKQQFPNAKTDQVLGYYELDQQEKRATELFQLNQNNPAAAQPHAIAMQAIAEQKNKLVETIGVEDYIANLNKRHQAAEAAKAKAAETTTVQENDQRVVPTTPEATVAQNTAEIQKAKAAAAAVGMTNETTAALTYLESQSGNTSQDVMTNGLAPAMITQLNSETQQLQTEATTLQQQYEQAKKDGLTEQEASLKEQLDEKNQQITSNQEIVKGINDLNMVAPKTENKTTDARAAVLFEDEEQGQNLPTVEAASAAAQEAVKTAAKTKGAPLTGAEVVELKEVQTAVAALKENGYNPTEAMAELNNLPALEDMTVKEMKAVESFVKSTIPENNSRLAAEERKAKESKAAPARKKAKAVSRKERKEDKQRQRTKLVRPDTTTVGLQDKEVVERAEKELGTTTPTATEINEYVDGLVREKDIPQSRAKAVKSRLKSYYGKAEQTARPALVDDLLNESKEDSQEDNIVENSQAIVDTENTEELEYAPSIEGYENEEEEQNAFEEATEGSLERETIGEITPARMALLEARSALSGNWNDYLAAYNKGLKQRPDGTYYLPDSAVSELLDIVLGKSVDALNKKYKANLSLDQRDKNGYFPDESNPLHEALNDLVATISEESRPDVEGRNYSNTVRNTARQYMSGERSIENEIKLAIDAIAKKMGLEGVSALEEIENIEDAANEIAEMVEDGEDILANIIDKNRGDKSTRAAESISKLIDYVYKNKIKGIDGAGETGLIHSHAFVSSVLRKNGGDVVKTIAYIQGRLSSRQYRISDITTRAMLESIAEVLYTVQEQLYENAKNINGHTGSAFTVLFVNNSLKSVFSSHVMKHNAVALNRAGLLSIFTANQSKIRSELKTEFEKGVSDMLSDIINNPEKSQRLKDIRVALAAQKSNPDADVIKSIIADLSDMMAEKPKIVDAFYGSGMRLLDKEGISKKAKREAVEFFLELTSPKSEREKGQMYQSIVGDYIRRNEKIFGNFAESKWRSIALKQNQSAIQKDNRLLSTSEKIRQNGLTTRIENPTGNDESVENNVVLNSDDRIYGTGERKTLLSRNPLIAIKSIASKLTVRQLSEFSIAKGKKIGVKADKLMREHLVLAKAASMLQAVKYNTEGYLFINQVTDSPRIYQMNGARIIKRENGFSFHSSVKATSDPINDYLLPEVQRAINAALAMHPNLTESQIAEKIPTFLKLSKTSNGYSVSYSEAALGEEARAEFKNYVQARISEYFNPSVSTNVIAVEKAKNMIVDAAMSFYGKSNKDEAKAAFKKAIDKISNTPGVEVNSGLKEFGKKFGSDQMISIKQSPESLMKEFIINEEFNRYYMRQFIRGGQEHIMNKDADELLTREKGAESPGIPVGVEMPFRYVVMDKNMYGGESAVGMTIIDSKGNPIKLSANPGDGVMFISEKANTNIAASVGPQMGYVDQYKYAMSTVNEAGEPTMHKAMQIVLTRELAENNPMLMKLYNYMAENNLDAILDHSAEKMGVENRLKIDWNEDSQMPSAEGSVHTANYADIYVQVPVNRKAGTAYYTRPEQEIRQATLLSDETSEQHVENIFSAMSSKIGASMFEAMEYSKDFLSAIRAYRETNIPSKRAEYANDIIAKLNEMKKGRSSAEATFYDSVIEKIKSGYTFEYDDGLIYNMQSSTFKEFVKNKMEGIYASLLTPLASKEAPKFRIDNKANSEIILPARFEAALNHFRDANGDVYVTGIKVPYNNAGTQIRAKVIFDGNLDGNGASAIVPNEYYALSNSDNDGDHLFVFPNDPNKQDYIDIFNNIGVDLTKNPQVDKVVDNIKEAIKSKGGKGKNFATYLSNY